MSDYYVSVTGEICRTEVEVYIFDTVIKYDKPKVYIVLGIWFNGQFKETEIL